MPETEVLVVGAGPSGLLLAAELARRGITCRIVEQAPARRTAPKAINLHSRSLEVFADLGIAEEAVALGNKVGRLNTYSVHDGLARPLVSVDLRRLDTPFPFTLTLPQPETERLLEERAAAHRVLVERGTRFAGLTQDEDAVFAELERAGSGEREVVRARWLVGCDGINSTVRESLGLSFDATRYPLELLCADVRLDWDLPHDEAHVFLSAHGTLRTMPMPGSGRWRLVADVPVQPDGANGDDLLRLQTIVTERGAKAVLHERTWCSRFATYRYFSPEYRIGRVLFAGDAAHVHSPLGAQGMNLGLQDSYNLAWKLALVAGDGWQPSLLDSYESERRPVADSVLKHTDRSTRLIGIRGGLAEAVRNTVGRAAFRLPAVQRRLARNSVELSVHYRHDQLNLDDSEGVLRRPRSAPVPGDRAPDTSFGPPESRRRCHDLLRGRGYVLLLFAGDSQDSGLPGIVEEVRKEYGGKVLPRLVTARSAWAGGPDSLVLDPGGELHRCWGARAGHLYLVRPDGYIGYRSSHASAEGVRRYLRSVRGLTAG